MHLPIKALQHMDIWLFRISKYCLEFGLGRHFRMWRSQACQAGPTFRPPLPTSQSSYRNSCTRTLCVFFASNMSDLLHCLYRIPRQPTYLFLSNDSESSRNNLSQYNSLQNRKVTRRSVRNACYGRQCHSSSASAHSAYVKYTGVTILPCPSSVPPTNPRPR